MGGYWRYLYVVDIIQGFVRYGQGQRRAKRDDRIAFEISGAVCQFWNEGKWDSSATKKLNYSPPEVFSSTDLQAVGKR